jgi:hypothetical protein
LRISLKGRSRQGDWSRDTWNAAVGVGGKGGCRDPETRTNYPFRKGDEKFWVSILPKVESRIKRGKRGKIKQKQKTPKIRNSNDPKWEPNRVLNVKVGGGQGAKVKTGKIKEGRKQGAYQIQMALPVRGEETGGKLRFRKNSACVSGCGYPRFLVEDNGQPDRTR